MPDVCCAFCCQNKRTECSTLSFYHILFGTNEKSLALRKAWATAIKQEKMDRTRKNLQVIILLLENCLLTPITQTMYLYFPSPKRKKLQKSNHYKDINVIFHVINTKLLQQNLSQSP